MPGMGKTGSTVRITQIPASGKVVRGPKQSLRFQPSGNPALSSDSYPSPDTQTQHSTRAL